MHPAEHAWKAGGNRPGEADGPVEPLVSISGICRGVAFVRGEFFYISFFYCVRVCLYLCYDVYAIPYPRVCLHLYVCTGHDSGFGPNPCPYPYPCPYAFYGRHAGRSQQYHNLL